MMRVIHTTGRYYIVRQSWREHYPGSELPSAGRLPEVAVDADDQATPDGDVALLYNARVEYVERDYVEEVRHVI
jgi:hypothetical protein